MTTSTENRELTYSELFKSIKYSPCTSFWLKNALVQLDSRDPVNAIDDAEYLVEILRVKLRELRIG